jgi:hypothetical protein
MTKPATGALRAALWHPDQDSCSPPVSLAAANSWRVAAESRVAKLIADPRSGGAPLERRPGAGQSEPEDNGLAAEGDTG